MKSTSNVLIGLLAGLAAGAALGLLLAPDSGPETRKKLNTSLKDLGDSIKERAADEIKKVTDEKDRIVSKAKAATEQSLNDAQDEAEPAQTSKNSGFSQRHLI